jgi:hypothetical protein
VIQANERHHVDEARERFSRRHAIARDVEQEAAHREVGGVVDAQRRQALAALLAELGERAGRPAQTGFVAVLDPDAARVEH